MSRPKGYAAWSPRKETREVLDQVQKVLAEYHAYLPMTNRQVYYRLIGAYSFPKTDAAYERLCDYLNRARRAGMVPWEAIRDDGGTHIEPGFYTELDALRWFRWHLPESYLYALDPQTGQPRRTELWVEAAGMAPMLANAVKSYGVHVWSAGGFDSVTGLHDHAERLIQQGPTRVLHVGDYDPSGLAILEAAQADILGFGADQVEFVRLAVTRDQIDQLGLETAPPKKSDRRAVFEDSQTCQAEAIPPDTLVDIVRQAILAEWDLSAADRVAADQAEAHELIDGLAERVREVIR